MSKSNKKQTANQTKADSVEPTEQNTKEPTTDSKESNVEPKEDVVVEPTVDKVEPDAGTEEPASDKVATEAPGPKARVSVGNTNTASNIPKTGASNVADKTLVSQVTTPTLKYVKIANDPDHAVNDFNRAKINMYNSLRAALRYPDSSNFMGTMSEFVKIVKENRDGAFSEDMLNRYTHSITLSAPARIEMIRLMSVFQQLTSEDFKSIANTVDFSAVFVNGMDEDSINRFRMWVLRYSK